MDKQAVTEEVLRLLRQTMEDAQQISESALLREELGIGSIEILTLVADLEDVFRITVRERDLREVETVADVVQLVLRLKENQS